MTGGTLEAPSGTLTLRDSWDTSAGGTFNHNNGTVSAIDRPGGGSPLFNVNSSINFYNFTYADGWGTGTVAAGDTIVVENDMYFNTAALFDELDGGAGSSLEIQGDLTVGYDCGDIPITFTGTGTQTITFNQQVDQCDGDITINKTSGEVVLAQSMTLDAASQDLVLTDGTLNLAGNDLTVSGSGYAFTLASGSELQLQGGETVSAPTTISSGATVNYTGSSGPYTLNNWDYHHLTLSGAATFALGAAESIAGNLTISDATGALSLAGNGLTVTGTVSNEGTIKWQGDESVTFTSGNDIDSGILEYLGDGDAAADTYYLPEFSVYDVLVNFTDASDTLTNAYTPTASTMTDNLWLYWALDDGSGTTASDDSGNGRDGTLTNMDGSTDWVSGATSINFTNSNALDFDGTNDYVSFTSDDSFVDRSVSLWFKTSDTATRQVLYEEGGAIAGMNLYIDSGSLYGGAWGGTITDQFLSGSISADTWHNAVLVYDSDGNFELFIDGVSQGTAVPGGDMPGHTADDALGAMIVASNFHDGSQTGDGYYFAGQMDDFRIYERTLTSDEISTLAAGDNSNSETRTQTSFTYNGSLSVVGGAMTATETINVAGDFSVDGGTFTANDGTINMTGTGTLGSSSSLYNVVVNTAGTVTLSANTDIDNDFTITSGTVDADASGNYALTVGGNWSNSGTFTPRSGTVTFDDVGNTSTLTGSTTFYNLTSTTAGKALVFTAGTTQTVDGTLTLTGQDGNLITLRSSADGVQWNLTVNGSSSVDYVDVKDSDASGGDRIVHATSSDRSVDSGNNDNWGFNALPTVTSITATQSSLGDGDVTITFTVDDLDGDDTLQAKIEYSLNGGSSWGDPTISTTDSETTATYGDPDVDNALTYQVGQAGAYITTSSGANTVTIVWEAATDVDASTDINNAQIQITPYDGTGEGAADQSANFVLDLVAPTAASDFAYANLLPTQSGFTWTAGSDTNFSHYEIWYASSQSDAEGRTGTALEWDDGDDVDLTTVSTTDTTIAGDLYRTYVVLFAVDDGGNASASSTIILPPKGSSSGSDESFSVEENYAVSNTSVEYDALRREAKITWTTGASVILVVLSYTDDGGDSYTAITDAVYNSQRYTWDVPDTVSGDIQVRVRSTDLVSYLGEGVSDVFEVAALEVEGDEQQDEVVQDEDLSPPAGAFAASPVTGALEEVSEVQPNSYIRGQSLPTVYYVDEQYHRRPFLDAQTFFTYEDDFDNVQIVTDATLPFLSLGMPMLPQAERVLVKVQSDPRVYFLDPTDTVYDPALRWVPTESLAQSLFGVRWDAFVVDVSPTLFPRFSQGQEMTDGEDVDTSKLIERESLVR